jgi:NADPH-dependent ferric siderophore reductase
MPRAPIAIGNLAESVLGRRARVIDVHEPAPGFVALTLQAAAPPGGWQPGHEIQFRVTPTLGRRYTVRSVPAPDLIMILAALDAAGPGTRWIRRLRVGTEVIALAGRHRPLRVNGTRCLYLGDGSALGTIDAYAQAESVVAVEVSPSAVAPLAALWPRYCFVPTADALQSWLEDAASGVAGVDGAVLLGHAQSIQRQRRTLIEAKVLPRRAITARPYWSTGKEGL